MASKANKKLSVLYILNILKEYSDEDHLLSQSQIVKKLDSLYGLQIERKSVGANLYYLIECGYDIVMTFNGCYLREREFEKEEIRYLIDAVFSSKEISARYAKDLANKLSESLSIYQRRKYDYIFKASEVDRRDSKEFFYNIDLICQAIEEKKKIQFEYKRFVIDKKDENHRTYIVNPYFLVNKQGGYYMVCNKDNYDNVSNYKVEKMTNIKILDTQAKPVTSLEGYEDGLDIAEYINDNIYMLSGETIDATIKLAHEYNIDQVKEWFGKNVTFTRGNDVIFAHIRSNEQALFYWSLQYGNDVEVIKPLNLRQRIRDSVNSMAERYR